MPNGRIDAPALLTSKIRCLSAAILLLLPIVSAALADEGGAAPRNRASWALSSTGLPTTNNYYGITFADIDNDGDLDLLATATNGGLKVYRNDGSGCWTAVSPQPVGAAGSDLRAGDLNNDGHLDVITGSPDSSNGIHLFRGNGTGRFTEMTSGSGVATTGIWRGIAIADVNKDGNLDFAASNGYSGGLGMRVYTGDGTGKFVSNSTGLPMSGERDSGVVLVDFNNDGNLDLAAGGAAGATCFLGNGGAGGAMSWTNSSTGLPTGRFTGVNATDADNDGNLDIVLSSYGDNLGVRVFRNVNNAACWTSISTGLPTNGHYLDVSSGDFDSDGNVDLIFGRVVSSGLRCFYGNGAGTWAENSTGLCSTEYYVGNEVADFNKDGSPDVVLASYSGKGVIAYKNMHSAPPQPSLTLLAPLGNVTWSGGSRHAISWNASSGTSPYAITLNYSSDGGGNFTGTIAAGLIQNAPGQNSCDWDLPMIDSARVRVKVSVKDAMNQTIFRSAPYDLALDSTPPAVTGTTPIDGALGVSTGTTVLVRFSEMMNLSTAAGAISISGPGSPALLSPAWLGEEVVFTTSGLQQESMYTVTVAASAGDDSDPGNPMAAPYAFTFNTTNGSVPSITLLAPQGGEVWLAGSVHTLTWAAAGGTGGLNISLAYSTEGPGGPWTPIAANETNDGSYDWTVPATSSEDCFITASATDSFQPPKSASDVNGAPFTIKEAPVPLTVLLTSPTGGEVLTVGSRHNITWNSSGGNGGRMATLEYSTLAPDGPWTTIAAGEPDDGSYQWTVPDRPFASCFVKVTVTDSYDPPQNASDVNAAAFTIRPLTVELSVNLTSPAGGENWTVGSAHNITWSVLGGYGNWSMDLHYSVSGASGPWTLIAANRSDGSSYLWTVPNASSSSCFVRVSVTDRYEPPRHASDQGRSAFIIWRPVPPPPPPADVTAPAVRVDAPAAGANVSGVVVVRATATDATGVVRMQLLIDGIGVASSNGSSLVYNWTVTAAVAGGQHAITVRAWDATGNVGNASINVIVTSPAVKPRPAEKSLLESYGWLVAVLVAVVLVLVMGVFVMRRRPPGASPQTPPPPPSSN